MIGFILYALALIMFLSPSTTGLWIFPLMFGMLMHWKFWTVGIVAFLVGAGWNKPF